MNKNINFTIKLASSIKKNKSSNVFKQIGKKCKAVVISEAGILKAKLITSPVESNDEFNKLNIIPFTPNSFKLKRKTAIFSNKKDKYNHYICMMRDIHKANLNPGISKQYHSLHERLLIEGYVVVNNGVNYFDYRNLIAFTENGAHINEAILIGNNT